MPYIAHLSVPSQAAHLSIAAALVARGMDVVECTLLDADGQCQGLLAAAAARCLRVTPVASAQASKPRNP